MSARASTQQVIDALLLAKGLSLNQGRDAESQAIIKRVSAWLDPITSSENIHQTFYGTSTLYQADIFANIARSAIAGLGWHLSMSKRRSSGRWNYELTAFYGASPWLEVLNGEAAPGEQKIVNASDRWTRRAVVGWSALTAAAVLAPLIPSIVVGSARFALTGGRAALIGSRLAGRVLLRTTNRGIAWYLEAQIRNPELTVAISEYAVGTIWYVSTSEDAAEVLFAEAATPMGVLSNVAQVMQFYTLFRGGMTPASVGPVVGRIRGRSGAPLAGPQPSASRAPTRRNTTIEIEIIESPASLPGQRSLTARSQPPKSPARPALPARLPLPAITKSTLKEKVGSRLTATETAALDRAPAEFLDAIVSTVPRGSVEKFRDSSSIKTRQGLISQLQGEIQEHAIKLTPEYRNAVADAQREIAQLTRRPAPRGTGRWGRFGPVRVGKAEDNLQELTDGLVFALETPPGAQRLDHRRRIHIFGVFEDKSRSNLLDVAREKVKAKKSFIDRGQVEKSLARLETGSITVDGVTYTHERIILGADRGRRTTYFIGAPYDARTDRGFKLIESRLSSQGRRVVIVLTPFRNRTYRAIARALLEILSGI